MPDTSTIWIFSLAAAALIVIPGPAVLYIVAQSVGQGRRAGMVSAIGVATGGTVHVVVAAIGLSGLLLSSATLFSAVKYVGAAYLLYLGFRRLSGRDESVLVQPTRVRSRRRLWRDGAVVNILNPKTALFFYAFLPQFIDPHRGSPMTQSLVLGAIFVAIALFSDTLWGYAAGSAAGWLRSRPAAIRAERWVTGGVFVGLGAFTAFSGVHRAAK